MPNNPLSHAGHAIVPLPITVVPAFPDGTSNPDDVSVITWFDSRNKKRSIVVGSYLRRYDFSFNDGESEIHRTADTDLNQKQGGFGYLVSHSKNGNSPIGRDMPAEAKTFFLGEHHMIHRVTLKYLRDWEDGGYGIQIPVVIDWFIASGRDHPIWAVTWKVSEAIKPEWIDFSGEYTMDVRAPYGALNFDGGEGGDIGGVGWGDCDFRFRSETEPLNLQSPWSYNTANSVNFVQAWMAGKTNAEMGLVQTRVPDPEMGYPDRVKGREQQHTSNDSFPNKGDCSDGIGNYLMPCIHGWPYQLMNNDWEERPLNGPPSGKVVAWGAPYGWLGSESFGTFGAASGDGRGHRCYAVFVVLGPKRRKVRLLQNPTAKWTQAEGDVERAIKASVALNDGQIDSVTTGSVAQFVRRGPGSSENKPLRKDDGSYNGYNDTYAAYYLNAADNQVAFTLRPTTQGISNPVFVIQGYSAGMPHIKIGPEVGPPHEVMVNAGAASGALVSIAASDKELWVTILADVDHPTRIEIAG